MSSLMGFARRAAEPLLRGSLGHVGASPGETAPQEDQDSSLPVRVGETELPAGLVDLPEVGAHRLVPPAGRPG